MSDEKPPKGHEGPPSGDHPSTNGDPSTGTGENPQAEPDEYPRKMPRYTIHDLRCVEDELGRKHFHTPEGRAVCGRLKKAKNRKIPEEACCGIPMPKGPCKVHGGKAGGPLTAGGRYSRVLKKWGRSFERALHDKELLDTRRELAMIDVLIEKLVRRAQQADTPSWREELRGTYAALDKAVKERKQNEVRVLLKQLGELIETGATHDQATRDLIDKLDRRANRAHKINELEVRREEKITVSEMGIIFARLIEVLKAQLDVHTFHRLIPELRKLVAAEHLGPAGSAQAVAAGERAGEAMRVLEAPGTDSSE